MEAAQVKLDGILGKCKDLKLEILSLPAIEKLQRNNNGVSWKLYLKTISIILALILWSSWDYINQGDCLFEMPSELSKIFRPPETCEFCSDVKGIERVSKITAEEFESKFAYSGTPVIIADGAKNWSAVEVFDFWYFKNLYMNARRKRKILNCQFFPYKSGFKNFYEALSIPTERVNYEKGTEPWYFGWSNCNPEVAEVLREHYSRPYFLPLNSENNAVDWIFMGGPGLGAHMHVDNVRLPSWQAQLRGSKEWMLAPPPECYYECDSFRVTINKGEIFVLDTNKWFHQTIVLPGDLSITIGAEFD